MNGGVLPFVLIGAAVALALTYASALRAWLGVGGFALGAVLLALVPVPDSAVGIVHAGFWISTIGAAALVLAPTVAATPLAVAAAINGGAWAGAFTATSEARASVAIALPVTLLFLPGRWFRCGERQIVLKVVSSWLIAVSALAAFVSLVPTPGYEADHME